MRTSDVKAALKKKFCAPEWALFFEVTAGTGAMASRRADAIAMNLWPSRGLAINGFEIKVSRSDWLRELKSPAKAEELAQHCDFWWIVSPKGIVSKHELPEAWGLYEVDGRGMSVSVQAPKIGEPVLSRNFMAALIRRAGEMDAAERQRLIREETEIIRQKAAADVERRVREKMAARGDLQEAVDRFERASGIKIDRYYGAEDLGRAAKIVQMIGYDAVYSAASGLLNTVKGFASKLSDHLDSIPQTKKE